MVKILVTGGAGYIGSVLVPTLLKESFSVTVIDTLMYGQASLLDVCHDQKLTIVRGDARNEQLVKNHLKGADYIFPLACYTGAPLCEKDPDGARSVNLDAVKLVLKLKGRDQRVIFPTTNSGYGIGEKDKECTEKSPLKPISHYGRLKVEAEKAVLDAGNAITFRLATAFGISPRMRLDLLVNDFVYRAVTDRALILFESHFKRNYIHVRDIAAAFIHGMNHFDQMKNESYNVGLSNCNLSKRELCQAIQKHVPGFYFTEAEVGEDPDKRDYIVSNVKIEKTGFRTKFSMNMGIDELIKGYQVIRKQQYSNV